MKGTSGVMSTTTMDGDTLNRENKSGNSCTTNITAGDDSPPTAKNHIL